MNRWCASIFVALWMMDATAQKVAPDGKLWALGVVGGADAVNVMMFRTGVQDFSNTLEKFPGPQGKSQLLFGGEGGQYYRKPDVRYRSDVARLKSEFLKNPDSCKNFREIFEFMNSVVPQETVRANPGEALDPRVTGEAGLGKVYASLDEIVRNAKNHDHVLINLNDHGMRWDTASSGYDYVVESGNPYEFVKMSELRGRMEALQKKGVTVHLNVQACFSGGFSELTGSRGPAAGTCTVSSTASDTPGYEADELVPVTFDSVFNRSLGKYGSQLQAFACGLANDSWNFPNTSLEHVVSEWERAHPKTLQTCCLKEGDLSKPEIVQGAFEKILQSVSDPLRKKLLEEYSRQVVQTMRECSDPVLPDDNHFRKKLLSCVDRSDLTPFQKEDMSAFLSGDAGEIYRAKMVNRNIEFLKKADLGSLHRYKDAFCCLSYNFITKKRPELCR